MNHGDIEPISILISWPDVNESFNKDFSKIMPDTLTLVPICDQEAGSNPEEIKGGSWNLS